ncbi:hypothetical protein CK221_29265 [Mesorhizobium sp. WSM3868]|nr:hypothetical protein CK221_29265 [Mesorhizobium sp. WSM3868]
MISKRRTSNYRSGKQDLWVKTTCSEKRLRTAGHQAREPAKPAAAIMARVAGTAFTTLPGGLGERLWKRVEEARAPKPAQRVPSVFALMCAA